MLQTIKRMYKWKNQSSLPHAMIESSISLSLTRLARRCHNHRRQNDGTFCDSTTEGLLLVVKNSVVLFGVSPSSPLPPPSPPPLPPPTSTPRPQSAAAMVMMMMMR